MSFTNALPCALNIELTQPPVILQSIDESIPLKCSEIAVRELFFLPNDLHIETHDTNIYSSNQPTEISWEPFLEDDMMNSFQILPGCSWKLPCYLADRDLYFRVSISGTNLWSKVYVFCRDILLQRSIFRKHKPEDLEWNYTRNRDVTLERGPQIKFKRVWKFTREIVFFSDYWVINKTGLAFFYETKPFDENVNQIVELKDSNDYKTLLFTETEYSDTIQKQFLGNLSVPILLNCPNRRLRIMPYCMMQEIDRSNFYLYDSWSSSGNVFNILTVDSPLQLYSDEDWTITSIPTVLSSSKNLIYIQTPNQDRESSPHEENFFSFKISTNCFVSVCIDARCRRVPNWMKKYGFLSSGERIRSTNPRTVYQVYRKFYRSHDCVRLGGNGLKIASDPKGSESTIDMYLIFISECPLYYNEPTLASITLHDSVWRNFLKPLHFSLKPRFKVGDAIFLDRDDISLTHLPSLLSNISLLAIQTCSTDLNLNYQQFINLTIQHPSRLYLCIDSSIDVDEYPTWISQIGFKITNLKADSYLKTFNLLCRSCGVEMLTIGSLCCQQKSATNYFLLLADEQDFLHKSHSVNPFLIGSSRQSAISLVPDRNDLAYTLWDSREHLVLQKPTFDEKGRHWSQYFDVAPGNTGELTTTCGSFSVQVNPLPGLFHRTSAVTFFPRFIIVNQLPIGVIIRPVMGTLPTMAPSTTINPQNPIELSPNESGILYAFTQLSLHRTFEVGEEIIHKRWIWVQALGASSSNHSRPISLDDIGEIDVWLPIIQTPGLDNTDSSASKLLISASVMLQDSLVVVTLRDISKTPPYRLENRSLTHSLEYRQRHNLLSNWQTLAPGAWTSYVWDDPYGAKYLELKISKTETISQPLCLDEIGQIPNISWNSFLSSFLSKAFSRNTMNDSLDESSTVSSGVIGGYIYANGITRVLILNEISSKYRLLNSFDFPKEHSWSRSLDLGSTRNSVSKTLPSNVVDNLLRSIHIRSSVCGLHLNLFQDESTNHRVEEILSIHLEGFLVEYNGQNPYLEVSVYHIQIDDMRNSPRFPVIFVPTNSGFNSHLSDDDGVEIPFIQLRCKWKHGSMSTEILHLSEFQTLVQPINVKLDMELLMYLARVMGKIIQQSNHHSFWLTRISPEAASINAAIQIISQTLNPHILQTYLVSSKRPIYIELFHYGSLIIYVEVRAVSRLVPTLMTSLPLLLICSFMWARNYSNLT
jgi:hypothetical protein